MSIIRMVPEDLTMTAILGQWAEETFPGQTPGTLFDHLEEEVDELHNALIDGHPEDIAEEIADCAILLAVLAYHHHLELPTIMAQKHSQNLHSNWRFDDVRGYHKRV